MYVSSDLASPNRISLMVVMSRMVLARFILDATSFDNGGPYHQLLGNGNRAIKLVSPKMLVLALSLMFGNYFNGCVELLVFVLQLKNIVTGEPSLVFTCILFGLYVILLGLLSEEYKIIYLKNKVFQDIDDFLVSFEVCFMVAGDCSWISTMYYLVL
jgi:hypothetical protein